LKYDSKKLKRIFKSRVARWFVFKIPILEKFGGALEWQMLLYFMTIWNTFRQFGTILAFWYSLCGYLVHFLRFGMVGPRKIWQPYFRARHKKSETLCMNFSGNLFRSDAMKTKLKRATLQSTYRAVLPDGIFSDKKTNLGKFWKVLQWKMLVFLMAYLSILRPNGIC
jgi:hypothetical protein